MCCASSFSTSAISRSTRAAAELADASIGMRGEMHDGPARALAAALYSGLAFGNSLKKAFLQACAAIGDEPGTRVPRLFFRHGVGPHEIVPVRPRPTI
jgi:hypothetical protein